MRAPERERSEGSGEALVDAKDTSHPRGLSKAGRRRRPASGSDSPRATEQAGGGKWSEVG